MFSLSDESSSRDWGGDSTEPGAGHGVGGGAGLHWPDQAAGADSHSSFNISNDLLAAWAGLSSGYLAVGVRGVSCDVTSDCFTFSTHVFVMHKLAPPPPPTNFIWQLDYLH